MIRWSKRSLHEFYQQTTEPSEDCYLAAPSPNTDLLILLSGKVVGWEYYSGTADRPFIFGVLRAQGNPQPGICNFSLIGVNSFSSSVSGYGRIDLSASDYISMKAGDYIAVKIPNGGNIR